MYPVHSFAEFRSAIAANTSASLAFAGKSTLIEFIHTSLQSRCLPATYEIDPGSSPTKTVPKPGAIDFDLRALTRLVKSDFIVAASALPSSI